MTGPPEPPPRRDPADVPALRKCLRCQTIFASEGFGERICRHCKRSKTWRDAARLSPRSSVRR